MWIYWLEIIMFIFFGDEWSCILLARWLHVFLDFDKTTLSSRLQHLSWRYLFHFNLDILIANFLIKICCILLRWDLRIKIRSHFIFFEFRCHIIHVMIPLIDSITLITSFRSIWNIEKISANFRELLF